MSKVITSTPVSPAPKRIVSGLQPSGTLHLGNYLGAVKQWVEMQDRGECFFFIADLHALTEIVDAKTRRESIENMLLMVEACGVDPTRSHVFRQSSIMYHTEMAWALMCTARTGWLDRMVQYRDKSNEGEKSVSAGLYTYPVLQAADILLYSATHVPVGDDQFQHLQLTRDIAQSFNHSYGETFVLPDAVMTGPATRVMSLKNGTRKMSKSDNDDMTRINLTDSNDLIVKKIRRATTDSDFLPYADASTETPEVLLQGRPEALNLLNILAAVTDMAPYRLLEQSLGNQGFGTLKGLLADAVVELIEPIRTRFNQMQADRQEHLVRIQYGADDAHGIAERKMVEVRSRLALD